MQPISVTYTTTGTQTPLSLDWRIVPFLVSYDVIKVTGGGTLSVTLETTLDDIMNPNVTPVWTALGSALTATTRGSLTAPVTAIRANIGTLTGTDVTLKILQGESIN
jgi:hypothetical protein